MGKGFNTFLDLSTAFSAADIRDNTKEIAKNQKKQLKIQELATANQANYISAQIQGMRAQIIQDWITNYPEDAGFLGQCIEYCNDFEKLTTFKMMSSEVGLDFLKRQRPLYQKLIEKCPQLISAFPQLNQTFSGMKRAEKNYNLLLEPQNEARRLNNTQSQPSQILQGPQQQEYVEQEQPKNETVNIGMLSAHELKSQIKIQKKKIRNLKDMYRNKVQQLQTRLDMAQMKSAFTFGLSSSANAKEVQLTNELAKTQTERIGVISAEEATLNKLKNELRSKK